LQAQIDAAKRKIQEKEDELARKQQLVKEEGSRKIAVLEAQKATATAESKAALQADRCGWSGVPARWAMARRRWVGVLRGEPKAGARQ
jgi:hypothetical protein